MVLFLSWPCVAEINLKEGVSLPLGGLTKSEGGQKVPKTKERGWRCRVEGLKVTWWHINVLWLIPLVLDPQKIKFRAHELLKGSDGQWMPGAFSLREVSISQHKPLIFIKAWAGVQACLARWIFPVCSEHTGAGQSRRSALQ